MNTEPVLTDTPVARLIGAAELEDFTGVKASTWLKMAAKGDGPPTYKVKGKPRWRLDEVMSFIESGRVDPGEKALVASRPKWVKPQRTKRRGLKPGARFDVLAKCGFRCVYCGRSAADGAHLEVDHKRSLADGGSHTGDNLVAACRECNIGKHQRSVIGKLPAAKTRTGQRQGKDGSI